MESPESLAILAGTEHLASLECKDLLEDPSRETKDPWDLWARTAFAETPACLASPENLLLVIFP